MDLERGATENEAYGQFRAPHLGLQAQSLSPDHSPLHSVHVLTSAIPRLAWYMMAIQKITLNKPKRDILENRGGSGSGCLPVPHNKGKGRLVA